MNKIKIFLIAIFLIANIQIVFADQIIQGSDITAFAKKYLHKNLEIKNNNDREIILNESSKITDITIPTGKYTLQIQPHNFSQIGYFYTVPVGVVINNQIVRNIFVNFKAIIMETVVVNNTALQKYEVITADKLEYVKKDVTRIRNNDFLYRDINELVGLRASSYIPANKIIDTSLIERIPIVLNKKLVKVIAKTGAISAELNGIAMEDGYLGDIIKIQNQATGKSFLAKVMGKNFVEVVL